MRVSWRKVGALILVLLLTGGVAVAAAYALGNTTAQRHPANDARDHDSTASAEGSAARYSVQIQAVFSPSGDPALVANFSPNGALATPRWSICSPPRYICVSARARHHELSPGRHPAGTVFRATANYFGHAYTARVTWHGRVSAVSRPILTGFPRVGALVTPLQARWRGGWGREFDQLGVEACPTTTSRHCVMVSGGQLGCPDHSRAILPKSVDAWYLFALDARSPADGVCAGVGYSTESVIPVWPLGRTVVRSAPLGPVAPALHPGS